MRTSWAGLVVVFAVVATGCPPTAAVQSVSPKDGATGVSLQANVVVNFNVEIEPATVNVGTFTVMSERTGLPVEGRVEAGGKSATFRATDRFTGLTEYTATIEGAKAKGGKPMAAPFTWKFRTEAKTLEVTSTSPSAGATQVAQDATIHVTFDAPVDASTVTAASFGVTAGAAALSGTRAVSGATISFTPTEPMALNRVHTVTVTSAVQGVAGEVLASPKTFTFTTATGPVTDGVSGRVTFDAVNADGPLEGGVRLDYANIVAKPARRIVVEGWESGASAPLAAALTDDSGAYTLPIPDGVSVTVRAYAWTKTTGYAADGVAPDACTGGSWDVRAVDNTNSKAQWGIVRAGATMAPAAGVNLHAATAWNGSSYTSRAGAPFFLIDQAVSAIERLCDGNPTPAMPLLYMNWSPNNVASGNDTANGFIGTSHYTTEGGISNLYVLGQEDSDTDEYDDHVVVHEFAHYLEDRLYRSDSIGGSHYLNEILDPRVAFGEGYGNALSGIVLADSVYVDTNGTNQQSGFSLDVAAAPNPATEPNDRGVYSERSMHHLLYMLWENRDLTPSSGRYDRIHTVLASDHPVTEALTCGQTFAAHYNARYGDAEGLYTLWGTTLDSPTNSLCVGSCNGQPGGAADVWDTDNDLGIRYASAPRTYAGTTQTAEFWRLYKVLPSSGFSSPGDGHDQLIVGGDTNELGMQRWYRYTANGTSKTFAITAAMNGTVNVCTTGLDPDAADFWLYDRGTRRNDPIAGGYEGYTDATCEVVSEDGLVNGRTYILTVSSYAGTGTLTGYGISVQ